MADLPSATTSQLPQETHFMQIVNILGNIKSVFLPSATGKLIATHSTGGVLHRPFQNILLWNHIRAIYRIIASAVHRPS
jgi:hypothetical protein